MVQGGPLSQRVSPQLAGREVAGLARQDPGTGDPEGVEAAAGGQLEGKGIEWRVGPSSGTGR